MVILLNGPPRCGKDTAAGFIVKHGKNFKEMKMSAPLKRVVGPLFNLSPDIMKVLEECKDDPAHVLFGKSYREVQIAISESLLKPMYGEDVFGKLFLNYARTTSYVNIVVSDTGFNSEVGPILQAYGSPNVYLVRIERDGTDFSNDSREWVNPNQFSKSFTIENKYDLELYEAQVKKILSKLDLLETKDE
jgi:hypothetical protein